MSHNVIPENFKCLPLTTPMHTMAQSECLAEGAGPASARTREELENGRCQHMQAWWRLMGKVAHPVEAGMGEEYGKGQGQHRIGWGGA